MDIDTRGRESATGPTAAVEDKISAAVDSAQQKVSDAIGPAKQSAQTLIEQQKQLGAEQLGGVARAVHSAAREFEDQLPRVAESVHSAAARLESASSSLRNRRADEVIAEVGRFAREQPAVFFGGAVLVGFALSRFLKSSAERRGTS
jgi:ABC-type transporter Mla subunit MlaD